MADPMIKKVDQVAMVVQDAKSMMHFFSDVFGVGPWTWLKFGDQGDGKDDWALIEDCVCEGEYIGTYSIDCCCCSMPNGVEIEIIGPHTGSSIFARYLERHGAGMQHISIVQDDFDQSIARMKEAGFEEGQLATVATEETCAFVNHLSVLGTYLELHKRPPVLTPVTVAGYVPGPDENTKPAKAPVFSQVEQVTIVTADIDASIRVLEGAYGLGPWERSEDARAKKAVCSSLNLTFILETPLDENSNAYQRLQKYGTDIRSMGIRVTGEIPDGVEVKDMDGARCIDFTDTLGITAELLM